MGDITIRRARPADAGEMAEVWIRSYAAALPGVRRGHTDQEVRDWFAAVVVPARESWVAVHGRAVHERASDGPAVVGLLVLGDTELEQLYLEPAWRGRGIGDRLLALAKRQRPDIRYAWR